MAKQASSGETKTPVIVALVFFVLATIGLGVFAFTMKEDIENAKADAKKATDAAAAADTAMKKAKAEALVFKAAMGALNEGDLAAYQGIQFKDDAKRAHDELMNALSARANTAIQNARKDFTGSGAPFSAVPDDLLVWNWPAAGEIPPPPQKALVDSAIAAMALRELNDRNYQVAKKRFEDDAAKMNKLSGERDTAITTFKDDTRAIPGKIAAGVAENKKQYDTNAAAFVGEQATARDTVAKASERFNQRDLDARRHEGTIKTLQRNLDELLSREIDLIDPFQFDKPQGKVLRRYSDSLVDIDLGTSDKLRAGLAFSIFPSDTVVRGMQPRMRPFKDQEGKTVYKPIPKGKIEVISVVGPNIAQCRIVDEDNAVRDRIIPGDLLYNALWRKGVSEHVVLFGIFDLDGDGRDDTQALITGLRRVGVVVDAYYDLGKNDPDPMKNWVGEITSQTNFGLEGYYPTVSAADGNRDAKISVLTGIGKARNQVKERGILILRPRDFFPRIGFNARLDISEEAINQAATSYARLRPADDKPAAPAPAEPAKEEPKKEKQ